jgi:hypothetical protein
MRRVLKGAEDGDQRKLAQSRWSMELRHKLKTKWAGMRP